MIDPELAARLDAVQDAAERAAKSADKTRKYLFWKTVVTVAFVAIPAVGLIFAIPAFISSYTSALSF